MVLGTEGAARVHCPILVINTSVEGGRERIGLGEGVRTVSVHFFLSKNGNSHRYLLNLNKYAKVCYIFYSFLFERFHNLKQ